MSFSRRALALCVATATACSLAPAAGAVIVATPVEHSAPDTQVSLAPIGTYESGVLGTSAAEIVAFHAASKRILTVNAQAGVIDVLDASDPTNLQKVGTIAADAGQEINSVAVRKDGLAVAAVQQANKTENHHSLASLDFEPEYITSADGKAFVTLQEANAIAIIDIATATVEKVVPAHVVDHSAVKLDSSNKDGVAELRNIAVKGLSMPDAVGAFTAGGATYFVTANEGDAREWGGYTEESEIGDLAKEGKLCDNIDPALTDKTIAGKLKVSTASGWNAEKNCFDELYSYGSRSFSIYDAQGNVVFDSGSEFEEITAQLHNEGKLLHNADNEAADFDDHSDNKGPESEALAIGVIGERTYAFIGAERVGGIFVYDVADPANAKFATYLNNRDFSQAEMVPAAGDLGPEGFTFVDKADSPNGKYLLIVGNEVSGTTTVYEVADLVAPADDTTAPTNENSSQRRLAEAAGIGVGIGALLMAAFAGAVTLLPQVRPVLLSIIPAQMRADVQRLLASRGM